MMFMGTIAITVTKKKKTGNNLNVQHTEMTEYIFVHLHYLMDYDMDI